MTHYLLPKCVMVAVLTSQLSCATMFTDRYARVELVSDEARTRYFVNGRRVGKGRRHQLMVNQRKEHFFAGKKKGCETTTTEFQQRVTGWTIVSVLTVGILVVVDFVTGAFHVADKTKYDVTPDCYHDDEEDYT